MDNPPTAAGSVVIPNLRRGAEIHRIQARFPVVGRGRGPNGDGLRWGFCFDIDLLSRVPVHGSRCVAGGVFVGAPGVIVPRDSKLKSAMTSRKMASSIFF